MVAVAGTRIVNYPSPTQELRITNSWYVNYVAWYTDGASSVAPTAPEAAPSDRPHRRLMTSSKLMDDATQPCAASSGQVAAAEGRHQTRYRGIVAQYCSGTGEHLVIFDSAALRPRWVSSHKHTAGLTLQRRDTNIPPASRCIPWLNLPPRLAPCRSSAHGNKWTCSSGPLRATRTQWRAARP